jgi:3-dehydroquinate synthase
MTADEPLRNRTIVLVGLMGAGKSSIGRRLAQLLGLPFFDADEEVERAARRTIPEIFADLGETAFRDGERRVIARLLDGPAHVMATGGGAFMNAETRALIARKAVSVWLKADVDVLARRVGRKSDRPLLRGRDARAVLQALADERQPIYAKADITVGSLEGPHTATVQAVVAALRGHLTTKASGSRTVPVGLGERAYEVVIGDGLIDQAGAQIAPLLKRARTAVVADETVHRLHGQRLGASLAAAGVEAQFVVIPPGEGSKSFAGLADLCDRLLALELDRGDVICALGGGVVGDLTGFAAAIYKRGVDFVQIPTTLLAQVDSSVGGKTAIDTARGKNLIGAFHQPRLVLADLGVLATLADREMRCGYAEVIKYGLLGDFAFFEWLEANVAAVLAREPTALAYAVARSVEMKAEIVTEDEREAGRRALLNLGHTFGHALEAEMGFGEALLHGEAVGLGMAMAFRFSASQALCPGEDAERAERAIAAAGLPVRMGQARPEAFAAGALIGHMTQDKKAEDGRITLILARGLGQAFTAKTIDAAALSDFLIHEGAQP